MVFDNCALPTESTAELMVSLVTGYGVGYVTVAVNCGNGLSFSTPQSARTTNFTTVVLPNAGSGTSMSSVLAAFAVLLVAPDGDDATEPPTYCMVGLFGIATVRCTLPLYTTLFEPYRFWTSMRMVSLLQPDIKGGVTNFVSEDCADREGIKKKTAPKSAHNCTQLLSFLFVFVRKKVFQL